MRLNLWYENEAGGMVGPGGSINFPKLSPSPTHATRTHHLPAIPSGGHSGSGRLRPQLPRQPQVAQVPENNEDEEEDDYIAAPRLEPLSFEQALAMGRGLGGVGGGRQLPSPMPNGYKPGQNTVDPILNPPERRTAGRRMLRPVPCSNRQLPSGEEGRSDSDEDDWC